MGENTQLPGGVSRVESSVLDLLEDEERRWLDLSILQVSVLRQMAFPWAFMPERLVESHNGYQTIVEMPQAYIDALEELELMLGGGYTPPEEEAMGDQFVNRGDPNANDFAIGSGLTADGTWRVLALNNIISDADANRVLIRGYFKDNLVGQVIAFRKYGNVNAYNAASHATQVNAVYYYFQCQVSMPDVLWIEYMISSGMDVAAIVVQGWWRPTAGYAP